MAQTAPYFHDGRFTTLEQVVNYYAQTAKPDTQNANDLPLIELNASEVQQLVAFLKVL